MVGGRVCLVVPALAALSAPAGAATEGVLFEATVSPVCTLTVGDNGTMAVSGDLRSLSSMNPGGSAGSVELATNGGVTVSVQGPGGIVRPGADTSTTNWVPSYSIGAPFGVGNTPLPTLLNGIGAATVTVHLEGTKSGSDIFAAGSYQATVTVRCE